MTIRERLEQEELHTLSPYAVPAARSTGRLRPKEPCDVRTDFESDRGGIIHCSSFRRLKHKTQVFLSPEGDHYRTRLTHTLEVGQIARVIARALRLNEDLTEAIAMGHDLGHPPFGHAGEETLHQLCSEGFRHNEQSLRVVDVLEKGGQGLNLTNEVRDGILCHTGDRMPATLEGMVVRVADRIAYVNHDLDDAVHAGVLTEEQIPENVKRTLGTTYKQRINTLVIDIIDNSFDRPRVSLSDERSRALDELRDFLFLSVYRNPVVKGEETKATEMLTTLYRFFVKNPERMPEHFRDFSTASVERRVCDYLAGMSDVYAVNTFRSLFIPMGWNKV